MNPTRIEERPLTLLGFSFFGDPFQISAGWTEENEIGRLWSRFMVYLDQNRQRIKHVVSEAVHYEVHITHEETMRTGEFEVFVGLEVDEFEDVPFELSAKIFPPVTYAVFTLRGEQITSDWYQVIYSDWLPRSGYQGTYKYSIQRYDERFKGVGNIAESVLEIYVPVKE